VIKPCQIKILKQNHSKGEKEVQKKRTNVVPKGNTKKCKCTNMNHKNSNNGNLPKGIKIATKDLKPSPIV
jgi:hypothetical protein